MRIGLVAVAETAEHLAQREMRAPVIVERETRFEIRLCLPPELLALAERAADAKQHRVLIVAVEPALGLLDLARRVRQPACAVELDELGTPFALEAPRDDFGALAIAPKLEKGERRGSRDLRLRSSRLGQPTPGIAQAGGVVRQRTQLLAQRGDAHPLVLRSVEDRALDQLVDQRRDVGKSSRGLRGAKLEPQRGGV